jgi:hypothetical protein
VPALGEELDEPAADLSGGQRLDPRVWGEIGVRHGRNGTEGFVSGGCNAPATLAESNGASPSVALRRL